MIDILKYQQAIDEVRKIPVAKIIGKVIKVQGLIYHAKGCKFKLNEVYFVENSENIRIQAQVVGFDHDTAFLMPLDLLDGIYSGAKIYRSKINLENRLCTNWCGKVINGYGEVISEAAHKNIYVDFKPQKINPLLKKTVSNILDVGIKSINGLLTIGTGQRIALIAESGVGKSTLIGMLAKQSNVDIVIIALIGEREREVKDFVESTLGKDGLQRSIVIAAPASESPLLRMKAAELAHNIAVYYRDLGMNVLLLMDSLTRYAQSKREVALSLGEMPVSQGYPASVFASISYLLEKSGNGSESSGSLTAIYSLLRETGDVSDPVVDASISILDGHIFLDKELAMNGQYPAINIIESISRCMPSIVKDEHMEMSNLFKRLMAKYYKNRDLITLGAYKAGEDEELDKILKFQSYFDAFFNQKSCDFFSYEQTFQLMVELLAKFHFKRKNSMTDTL
ncbi:FliI/YscN family ATPase [Paraphotobacterium marinum]|uniref:FliI/YscN family ATPase n=1 Tax=Paraphotobacterium marinum TaxID=1755811 RepID=UPI0013140CC5|nr:FliI/YscN family ATPase [Paraphotobacterium marinum]